MMNKMMEEMHTEQKEQQYAFHELQLTRSLLLDHLYEGTLVPGEVLRSARNYNCVTHWEELLCVALNPKAERLLAVAGIHQPDGYSGILRSHGSREYVRFFIDWGCGEGYQHVSLSHFKVSDEPLGSDLGQYPRYHLVSAEFDSDRYWEGVLDGIHPTVCAVLSWNQVPPTHTDFQPVFGNLIESRIRVDSEQDVMVLFESQIMQGGPEPAPDLVREMAKRLSS